MTEYRFVQVDAFADRPFTGNPAAVVLLERWLPDATLQAVAEENNLAETAFLIPAAGDEADYELRWFSPTTEIAFCGHATLASGHVLIGGRESLRFSTRKAGILVVRRGKDDQLELDAPLTLVRPAADDQGTLSALGTSGAELYLSYQGAEATAVILVADEAAVRALTPDMAALRRIDLMAIVTARAAAGADCDVVSRVFVPAWGVDEDPVTGSAHAALTPFWAERLGRPAFTAFQASRRGGRVECRIEGGRAVLGGRCVTVIEGMLLL